MSAKWEHNTRHANTHTRLSGMRLDLAKHQPALQHGHELAARNHPGQLGLQLADVPVALPIQQLADRRVAPLSGTARRAGRHGLCAARLARGFAPAGPVRRGVGGGRIGRCEAAQDW